jgi:hypothetical protein
MRLPSCTSLRLASPGLDAFTPSSGCGSNPALRVGAKPGASRLLTWRRRARLSLPPCHGLRCNLHQHASRSGDRQCDAGHQGQDRVRARVQAAGRATRFKARSLAELHGGTDLRTGVKECWPENGLQRVCSAASRHNVAQPGAGLRQDSACAWMDCAPLHHKVWISLCRAMRH